MPDINLHQLAKLTTLIDSVKNEAARLGLDAVVVYMARAIQEIKPHVVLPEQVPFKVPRGRSDKYKSKVRNQ